MASWLPQIYSASFWGSLSTAPRAGRTSRRLTFLLLRRLILRRLVLPPVLYCRGTSPTDAAKSQLHRYRFASPIFAANALAVTGLPKYVSIHYTERLAETGVESAVDTVGDSYDNALAETINGPYKAELIHRRGPWRRQRAVDVATLEWVDWFNNRRLFCPIGDWS
ncbi:Integrase catalytic region (plasmid) [Paraburkholderia atlantica]|uniref:Integrase catalytic region n=1 Tax=Paraburkholderia atlantica TaxID=2654982 RepID=D5WP25_PARAM|nr:Integrase catalytic region [Paraburkholderia atlantica]